MVNFLKLWRWPNLIVIAVLILCLKYLVFEHYLVVNHLVFFESQFSAWQTFVLILSIILLSAGGYLINDMRDVAADRINKKGKVLIEDVLTPTQAWISYLTLTGLGVGLGIFLAFDLGLRQLIIFPLLGAASLYSYAHYFKSTALIGNIVISLMSASVPLYYFAFEAYPFVQEYGQAILLTGSPIFDFGPLQTLLGFTLFLAAFAFTFSLLREIIKDLQDVEGDQLLSGTTTAQYFGVTVTLNIARAILVVCLLLLFYVNYFYIEAVPYNTFPFQTYFYFLLIFPCLYLLFLLSKKSIDYGACSLLVKLTMLFGILSTGIYALFV